jgi:Retroviral aspartyl protease
MENFDLIDESQLMIIHIAATHDKTLVKDHKFRLAQCCTYVTGKWLCNSNSDHRYMATLIKVNGLEAYTLPDSGSTIVSITHNFACVAKLNIMQLENPIALQLGMVGSQSVINFGSRTLLELRLIKDDNIYLDMVNIDCYNMIIGTLFIWKHRLMLDFSQNKLHHQGQTIYVTI